MKVVEVQLLPLPKRNHAMIAHLQGKLTTAGCKRKARVCVESNKKHYAQAVSVSRLEHNRKR